MPQWEAEDQPRRGIRKGTLESFRDPFKGICMQLGGPFRKDAPGAYSKEVSERTLKIHPKYVDGEVATDVGPWASMRADNAARRRRNLTRVFPRKVCTKHWAPNGVASSGGRLSLACTGTPHTTMPSAAHWACGQASLRVSVCVHSPDSEQQVSWH